MAGPVQFSFANAEQAAPGAVRRRFEDEEESTPEESTPEESTPEEQPGTKARSTKTGGRQKPINVVALAKTRLKEVKAELRLMKALEKERAELERLIAAATNQPRVALVRENKRAAG